MLLCTWEPASRLFEEALPLNGRRQPNAFVGNFHHHQAPGTCHTLPTYRGATLRASPNPPDPVDSRKLASTWAKAVEICLTIERRPAAFGQAFGFLAGLGP
ncbi:predicted protein [Plenodomus lingam JN3]|uniref:Predicted protein n=1 Tax=Leptosphaeria maculans (strain JN3 / isolate v23.1.3 / race Av1-4-5-6-7-8) TaxID=985895 RepID=E5R4Z7_LEPMJ|nr:predicted protein [Plenodomus lingam JN3]CBX92270.1 predicted protein [Plenodomus lingam JN3]